MNEWELQLETDRLRIALIWGAALFEFQRRASELIGEELDITSYPPKSSWTNLARHFEIDKVDVAQCLLAARGKADDLLREFVASRPDLSPPDDD